MAQVEAATGAWGPLPLVVGVTGHNDLDDAAEPVIRRAVRDVLGALCAARGDMPVHVLSALAEGADQLVAEVACDLGLPLIAVLPMRMDAYRRTMPSEDGRQRLDRLWAAAATRIELPPVRDAAPQAGDKLQYEQAGIVISRHSHLLLALWNGLNPWRAEASAAEHGAMQGGTAHVVHLRGTGEGESDVFGRSAVFPGGRSVLDLTDSGPTLRIATPRRKERGSRGEAGSLWLVGGDGDEQAVTADQLLGSMAVRRDDHAGAAEFMAGLRRANAVLVRTARQQPEVVAKSRAYLLSEADLATLEEQRAPADRILAAYGAADAVSQHYQRRTYRAAFALVAALPVAVLSFELYAHAFHGAVVLGLYLAVIAAAYALYRWGVHQGQWQSRFQDYRALAEALRVQLFWGLGGVPCGVSNYYLRKHRDELSWIHDALRAPGLWAIAAGLGRPRVDLVRRNWIDDQRRYFVGTPARPGKAELNRAVEARLGRWADLAYGSGLALGAVLLVAQVAVAHLDHVLLEGAIILMGLAPAIAGALSIYAEKRAFKDHAHQYGRMGSVFQHAGKVLDRPGSDAAVVFRELGAEALSENGDWLMAHRDRKVEPIKGG